MKTVTERNENKQCRRDVFDALSHAQLRNMANCACALCLKPAQNTPSFAVVFGAIPQQVIHFVRTCESDSSEAIYVKHSTFLGYIDILKHSCTIRNILKGETAHCGPVYLEI